MKKLEKKTLDGNVETFILSILSDGPSYGYAIAQDLKKKTEGLLELGEGTIYPVLYRMEQREIIKSYWHQAENKRKRKYYKITPKGKKALSNNMAQWQQLVIIMDKIKQNTNIGNIDKGVIS